jgi:hypothetical protein
LEICISTPSCDETNCHRPKSEIKVSIRGALLDGGTGLVPPGELATGGTGLVPPGELANADPVAVTRRAAVRVRVRILRVMVELQALVAPP